MQRETRPDESGTRTRDESEQGTEGRREAFGLHTADNDVRQSTCLWPTDVCGEKNLNLATPLRFLFGDAFRRLSLLRARRDKRSFRPG